MQELSVEILLAAYNGEAFVREQIESILAQTDASWHLTVSDDGSQDGTAAILDAYAARYPQKIRRVRAGRRFGCARDHFFWLMRQCDADYIAFSDQDDVFYPHKMETLMRAMRDAQARLGEQTPILVFSDQTVTDARLETIAPSLMRYQKQDVARFDYRGILMQNVVTGGAMMINRALSELADRCAAPSETIMHDWWLAAVAARFGEIVYIDEPLCAYRQHGDNSVGAKDVGSMAYVLRMLGQLRAVRGALVRKKAQARVFRQTYADRLREEDLRFLDGFVRGHSGPAFYLRHRALIHGGFRLAGMMLLG